MDHVVTEKYTLMSLLLGAVGLWYTKEANDTGSAVEVLRQYLAESTDQGVVASDVTNLPSR